MPVGDSELLQPLDQLARATPQLPRLVEHRALGGDEQSRDLGDRRRRHLATGDNRRARAEAEAQAPVGPLAEVGLRVGLDHFGAASRR